jgi:serine/threonine protein kinase
MSQCLNPDCLAVNLENHRFCQKCGKSLWLKERYQALKLIGQGGFGKTFLAIDHDKPSKPHCVIKQFFPQMEETGGLAKAEQLFAEEAKRLDELGHHDQIPSLLAYFTIDDEQYLVQEYVEGENLEEELQRSGVFSQDKIIDLLSDLLPVLDFIHAVPIIHRDIKPENIIRRTKDQKLVLVDFGAAKRITLTNRSVTGTMIGSAEYVAPEQINGKAIVASDLYSLGVTCLHLLTGISPLQLFDSDDFEWVWRQYLASNIVSDQLGNILDKLIMPGTKKRYKSVEEIKKDFKQKEPLVSDFPQNIVRIPSTVSCLSLEKFLKQQKWKKANEETGKILLAFAKENTQSLTEEEIKQLPCDVLKYIDYLWSHYSESHFGLKKQMLIYRQSNNNYELFC